MNVKKSLFTLISTLLLDRHRGRRGVRPTRACRGSGAIAQSPVSCRDRSDGGAWGWGPQPELVCCQEEEKD